MRIRVLQTATHVELISESSCVTQAKALSLHELTAGTPSIHKAVEITLLDTLALFLRETTLRKALVEINAPSRNLWLLEQIDIWNYAIEKGMIGTKIAYVVAARSVDRELSFAEHYAGRRGIALKFFTARSEALAWLLYQQVPFASGRESRSAVAIGPAVREASLAELMSRRDCVHAYGGLTLPDVAA